MKAKKGRKVQEKNPSLPFQVREWWYANNPRQGLQANVGMDCAWVKRAFVELNVSEEEFQKLSVFGWGHADQRIKEFCRLGIPTFVKEIPHLREVLSPGIAWCPPEEQRAERYAQGAQVMDQLKQIAQGIIKKPKPGYVEDREAKRKFMGVDRGAL